MSAAGRAKRERFDFYSTPDYTIKSLLEHLVIHQTASAFEPCLGAGDITKHLTCDTIYYCELNEGVDYLSNKILPSVDLIITNPPFLFAQEFIVRSHEHCLGVIAYLLRVNFLGSQKRKNWWQTYRPTHLYVLSTRPSFNGISTDATEYAWFIWDRKGSSLVTINEPPGIYII